MGVLVPSVLRNPAPEEVCTSPWVNSLLFSVVHFASALHAMLYSVRKSVVCEGFGDMNVIDAWYFYYACNFDSRKPAYHYVPL